MFDADDRRLVVGGGRDIKVAVEGWMDLKIGEMSTKAEAAKAKDLANQELVLVGAIERFHVTRDYGPTSPSRAPRGMASDWAGLS